MQAGVIEAGSGVELAGRFGKAGQRRSIDLRGSGHQDFPRPRRQDWLVHSGAGAEQGKLRIVSGRSHRNADRQAEQLSRIGVQLADHFARIDDLREERLRDADLAEDLFAELVLGQIEHLARARHRAVGREDAGQPMIDQRRDEQPVCGFVENVRSILAQPDELVERIERKVPDARNLLQTCGIEVLADVRHDRGRARTLPADDRVEQGASGVDRRAIDAKRRDRDADHTMPRSCQFTRDRRAALCELAEDFIE